MPNLAGEKFELRLIRSLDVMLHEECEDERSGRISGRLKSEKVLYNPLILGKYKKEYILLDGANRFEALRRNSCRLILAQVVDYQEPEIMLRSWYHYVNGLDAGTLKKFLKRKHIRFENTGFDIKPISVNEIIVHDSYWESLRIKLGKSLAESIAHLRAISKFYESNFNYHRVDSDSELEELNNTFPGGGTMIMYPQYSKENIIKICNMKLKLPAGITQHLIPNRVLHIKYPLENLKSNNGLDKKNSDLMKFVIQKINRKQVRLYKEPILIFDE
jgi:hypothetical protein